MLTIKDLSMNEELDRAAMRSVLGGMNQQGALSGSLVLTPPQSLGVDQPSSMLGLGAGMFGQNQNGFGGQNPL
ncbi:hypothetical protein [Thiorhodococcus minor]|uniref:Uncharacterized protein n=1 Tax=Thiorhodococcus minor TaxID=57489 RepID=A0A6M0K0R1_9GAMM|nr:hypothetical protein [Thiorhodococcus minor]NEV63342.1 hypothetical protein [Thiorhodococcus minor]